jgi:hypothetical protein
MPSIAYRVEPRSVDTANGTIETSIVVRHGETAARAADLLGNAATTNEATARAEARDFLSLELADGPLAVNEIKRRADDAGIAWRTLERAKQQLGVRSSQPSLLAAGRSGTGCGRSQGRCPTRRMRSSPRKTATSLQPPGARVFAAAAGRLGASRSACAR